MTIEQFIGELRGRYGKDWTIEKSQDIEYFSKRMDLGENEIRNWLIAIKENYNYSTFPRLANIKSYIKRKVDSNLYYWNPEYWQGIDVFEIYQLWLKISDKIKKLSNYENDNHVDGFKLLTNKEQDVFLNFKDLHSEYTYMSEKNYPRKSIISRLEFLRKKILAKEHYTLLKFQKYEKDKVQIDCLVSQIESGIKRPPDNPDYFNN